MLKSFSVKNFRGFKDRITLSLKTDDKYDFNADAVAENTVMHGAIYGVNGSGKSNLGLAMVDIAHNIQQETERWYPLIESYTNGDSESELAEFDYELEFCGSKVHYSYKKNDLNSIDYESLEIDGKRLLFIDRQNSSSAEINMSGASGLKRMIESTSLSLVRYVHMNTILDNNHENTVFNKFINFVENMVFFRSVTSPKLEYVGAKQDIKRLSQEIIKEDRLDDFETFLNDCGISCKLQQIGEEEDARIHFKFSHRTIEFSRVASSGTLALGNFYYWWMKLGASEPTLIYVDEFDAFYHFDLSRTILKKLNQLTSQTLVTTHNVALLSNEILRPDAYFILSGNEIQTMDKKLSKNILYYHDLEKIYKSVFKTTEKNQDKI